MSKTTQDGADDDVVHCLFRWSQVAYDPSQGDIINGDKLRRDAKNAHAELSRLRSDNERLREALRSVRAIITEGALEGFRPEVGDWADRLFRSQAMTSAALQETSNG